VFAVLEEVCSVCEAEETMLVDGASFASGAAGRFRLEFFPKRLAIVYCGWTVSSGQNQENWWVTSEALGNCN